MKICLQHSGRECYYKRLMEGILGEGRGVR